LLKLPNTSSLFDQRQKHEVTPSPFLSTVSYLCEQP
jgi:hypothetical protein